MRWALLGLGIAVTLVALFYTVENWRGIRAWKNCKRELLAQGVTLDWNSYLPPPVPDDQNFFKAPKMQEWFVGRGQTELSKRMSLSEFERQYGVTVALATVTSSNEVPADTDLVLDYDEPSLPRRDADVRKWLAGLVERARTVATDSLRGATLMGSRNIPFVAQSLKPVTPARIVLQTKTTPDAKALAKYFPGLRVEPTNLDSFRLILTPQPCYSAADYLAWSDPFESDFDLIREALARPYARMDGDYQNPATQPIPNFICVRTAAQTLADRVKCNLLLGRPEQAFKDLTLIHDMCRLLDGAPTGKPMTLVAAMIHAAVAGLYAETIADGLRLHVWREPQLIAIEAQLKQVNLPPLARAALATEPAAVCRMLESAPLLTARKVLVELRRNPSGLAALKGWLMPRGWVYQNMATIATQGHRFVELFDAPNGLPLPDRAATAALELQRLKASSSPYTMLARIALPNYVKAWESLARHQTVADEARVACALERYLLAHHHYPREP